MQNSTGKDGKNWLKSNQRHTEVSGQVTQEGKISYSIQAAAQWAPSGLCSPWEP